MKSERWQGSKSILLSRQDFRDELRTNERQLTLPNWLSQCEQQMPAFAEIYGEWSDYFGEYKWQKLTTCAAYYHFDWNSITMSAHNSLADCFATLYCFKCIFGRSQ